MKIVDISISVYGKPYQTAATLLSLMKYSGQHIDKIYLLEELQQPYNENLHAMYKFLNGLNIVYFKPKLYLGWGPDDITRLTETDYRRSIRYQMAWEDTDKNFLFICHNDCFFSYDIIGEMLNRLSDGYNAAVGQIGQCWNCPAAMANLCNGNNYRNFKPTYPEVVKLIQEYPSPRTKIENINTLNPMPLPECRLNEFACLINVSMLKNVVMPFGDVVPFGYKDLDVGCDWFRALVLRGYHFSNWEKRVGHMHFSQNVPGHASNTGINFYRAGEERAKVFLEGDG